MRSMAVMGRDCGYLALMAGIAGGAEAVERLAAGESGILVGQLKGVVAATPLDDVAGKKKPLDPSLFVLARAMSS